jgi:hypothetical protein
MHSNLSQPTADTAASGRRAWGQLGWPLESGIVALVVVGVWVLLAPLGYLLSAAAGVAAVTTAAMISLVAALAALAAGRLFRGPLAVMYGMLAGMLVRMTVVLAIGMTLQLNVPGLMGGAMILYLVVFYVATLAVETALGLAKLSPRAALSPPRPAISK